MVVRGLLKEHYCKVFVKIPEKAYFHFSHYKSMETKNCHSNETTCATTIKNIIYVEDNNTNIMQSFSFIPLMTSEIFKYFFSKI